MLRWRREEKREVREEKRVVSLQSSYTQELRNFVRETSGPCIDDEELTTI
jgi:hypothetical protein